MAFGNINIKNNIFLSMTDAIEIFTDDGLDIDDVYIINNSFYDCDEAIKITTSGVITNTKIVNNPMHGNGGATGITTQNHNSGAVDFNCIFGYTTARSLNGSVIAGANGKNIDPLFNDPYNEDLTLRYGSPCLDAGAGIGTHSEVPIIDFLNINRPILQPDLISVDDGTDIGAYEMQQLSAPPVIKNYKQFPRAERFTGAQRIIDIIESDVNEGTIFQSTHTQFLIASTEYDDILIITPPDTDETYKKTIKLLGFFAIASGQPWRAELYKNPNATAGSTNKIGSNHNLQSNNTPLLIVNEDPTIINPGILIDEAFFGGGTGDKKDASLKSGLLFAQWVLAKDNKYIIRLVNNTGNENSVSVSLYWKEYNTHI